MFVSELYLRFHARAPFMLRLGPRLTGAASRKLAFASALVFAIVLALPFALGVRFQSRPRSRLSLFTRLRSPSNPQPMCLLFRFQTLYAVLDEPCTIIRRLRQKS